MLTQYTPRWSASLLILSIWWLIYDCSFGVLGTSGGSVIFGDTVNNLIALRLLLCDDKRRKNEQGLGKLPWVYALSFLFKFLSPVIIGLIVPETFSIRGFLMHFGHFTVGYCLIWLYPGDSAYRVLTSSLVWKLFLVIASSLFRLRKAFLAINAAIIFGQKYPNYEVGLLDTNVYNNIPVGFGNRSLCFVMAILTTFLALDLTVSFRAFILYLDRHSKKKSLSNVLSMVFTKQNIEKLGHEAGQWVLENGAIVVLLLLMDGRKVVEQYTCLLIYFFHKLGAIRILERIHALTMNESKDIHDKDKGKNASSPRNEPTKPLEQVEQEQAIPAQKETKSTKKNRSGSPKKRKQRRKKRA